MPIMFSHFTTSHRLYVLPDSLRHAVLVTTVPVIFPSLPLSEKVMHALDSLPLVKGAMQKTGLAEKIYDSCARLPCTFMF